MKSSSRSWLFVAVVLLVPLLVFALVDGYQRRFQPLPVLGQPNHTIADFTLHNQHGKVVTRQQWNGKIVVANFFFTHCPSICPKMMHQLQRVQQYGYLKNLQLASFTVDPERDSVGQLAAYAARWNVGVNWNLLTGSKKELYNLARNSFLVTATSGDGGPDDFIHSDQLVLIDTTGRLRGFYNGTGEKQVDQLLRDLKKLAAE